jgi:hypothetical protein|tara:strand:+ start:145 stop:285 length:141 start_codon:yes stop_codon:yes gene_type:complete
MGETIVISQGSKMQQVAVKTIVKGKKNRKGKPYMTSVTKHIKKRRR